MSSANGVVGVAGIGAYTATEHGIVGVTRLAALEYSSKGARVNALGPGYVDTPCMKLAPEEVRAAWRFIIFLLRDLKKEPGILHSGMKQPKTSPPRSDGWAGASSHWREILRSRTRRSAS
jgi:NAD(P)-dependent dehydrogenase (short-subunit alcohol dehydrogenase family)